jgi:prepilin-type N-terminal cleavage/methylation domain-containing protein
MFRLRSLEKRLRHLAVAVVVPREVVAQPVPRVAAQLLAVVWVWAAVVWALGVWALGVWALGVWALGVWAAAVKQAVAEVVAVPELVADVVDPVAVRQVAVVEAPVADVAGEVAVAVRQAAVVDAAVVAEPVPAGKVAVGEAPAVVDLVAVDLVAVDLVAVDLVAVVDRAEVLGNPMRNNQTHRGFTLLEVILSLALIVVATALIGSLMQMFARNFASRGDDIRREQLARALLSQIADDIRGVVMPQEYDPSVLEQLMGSSGGGGGGSTATATETAAAPSSATTLSSASTTTDPAATAGTGDELALTVTTSLPPGLYGDQFSLIVDVSRIPKPDEYIVQPAALTDAFLTDVPGDMKTVTYYVQQPTTSGIQDALSMFRTPNDATATYPAGLVRRQLDRGVTAYAEEMGNTQRLQQTGDLLAPEVVALEFAYFDGVDWLFEWDSSTQSLPWLIEITLAMQTASASAENQLSPGISISTMSYEDRQAFGVEIYQLIVAIPGAQLRAADAASADQAAGMESLGL